MRRYLCAAAAAAVAALFTAVPAFASSNAVLSDSAANPNGTNTAVNAVLTANLKSGTHATFYTTTTGTTGISCSSSNLSATVLTNPTAPGTATASLTALNFPNTSTNCTVNGGGRTVNSITVDHLSYNASVSSDGSVSITAGSNGAIHTTAVITTIFFQQITCGYTSHNSNVSGSASNTDNSLTFTNQQFDGDSTNNFQCPTTSYFTAKYAPVVDSNNGNASVFTN